MEFGAALEVLRISVNAGNSLGSSGIETDLPPSMTVGTGFFGAVLGGENLQPKHFVQWTRLAYNSDPAEAFGNFSGLIPWEAPAGPVPPYPYASNWLDGGRRRAPGIPDAGQALGAPARPRCAADRRRGASASRIWRGCGRRSGGVVIEELSQLVGGSRRG